MRQFVLPADYSGESRLILRGRSFHYLREVLRLPVGSTFPGMDTKGTRVTLTIVDAGKSSCTVSVEPVIHGHDPSPSSGAAAQARSAAGPVPGDSTRGRPRITLFQCLPKGRKMDLIVRQAAEAGIDRIVPVMSEHSIARIDAGDSGKTGRWHRIIREALQQSGTDHLPILEYPLPFDSIPAEQEGGGTGLFFHERPLANKTLHEYLLDATDQIALVVGPEGGLSEKEVALLTSAGFGSVWLGESVLRVETAALYSIAAVQIVLLERDSWKARPRSNG